MIYTVTAIDWIGIDCRTFGYFLDLESAIRAVENNHGSMQECYYRWIVIEKQGPGIHAIAEDVAWYEWLGNRWISVKDRPANERMDGIVNFNGIG